MNDSSNATPGAYDPKDAGDERTTPSSPASPDAAADETLEQPTAHTLPYRTGPTPAHYVSSAPSDSAHDGADQWNYGAQQYSQQQAYREQQSGPQQFGQQPYTGQPYGQGQVPASFANPKRRPRRLLTVTGAVVAGVVIAGVAGAGAYELGHATGEKAASAAGQSQTLQLPGGSSGSGSSGTFGQGGSGSYGGVQGGSGSGTGTVPTAAIAATATEKQGLVTIVSTLNYDESSKSAGTGMVMTSDGEILTNNHVVQGATSVQVTVVSTGKTYTANVVGTDAKNDVAVLKLVGASGLTPVTFDQNTTVKTGDAIHSTGNAEGTGSLVTAKGTVSATKQSITVQSESGSGTESLSNLIEISADVVSGDSGGPLRNSDGKVIGIVTAASSGTSAVTGYAIPISSALSIAGKIQSGESSSTIVIGLPAFLGAQISSASTGSGSGTGTGTGGGTGSGTGTSTPGVTIAGTVSGSAAAKAGLVAGDTITAVGGTSVADSTALTAAIRSHKVGDSVKISYTDAAGASHTITVTLGAGPAA